MIDPISGMWPWVLVHELSAPFGFWYLNLPPYFFCCPPYRSLTTPFFFCRAEVVFLLGAGAGAGAGAEPAALET